MARVDAPRAPGRAIRRIVSVRLALSIVVVVLVALRLAHRAIVRRRQAAARAAGGCACPSCGARRLVITEAIDLPGDAETPAITISALACRRCDLRAVGATRGARTRGYPVAPLAWGKLSAALRSCPAPRDRACGCPAHALYGERTARSWRGLDHVPHEAAESFDVA